MTRLILCAFMLWVAPVSAGEYWLHHIEYIGNGSTNRALLMPEGCAPLRAFITSPRLMQNGQRFGYPLGRRDPSWAEFQTDRLVLAPSFYQADEINRNMERYHAEILCVGKEGL